MGQTYGKPKRFQAESRKKVQTNVCITVSVLGMLMILVAFFSLFFLPYFITDHTVDRPVHESLGVTRRSEPPPQIVVAPKNVDCPVGFRAQTPLGASTPECVARMPYPRAVDEEIINYEAKPCDSFAKYACGLFKGHRESGITTLSFDTAGRGADRMFEAVVRMDAAQVERGAHSPPTERSPNGVIHDFVLSCVYSSARPNTTDDLQFAHDTLEMFETSSDHSDAFRAGWAIGTGVGLGDEAVLSVQAVMNPAENTETVMHWDVGTQLRMLPLISPEDMRTGLETACRVLVATGHFPFDTWTDTIQCRDDTYRLFYSLARNSADSGDASVQLTYEYFRDQIWQDLFSTAELGNLVESKDFVHGVLAGLADVLELDRAMLAEHGFGLPDLEALRGWVIQKNFVKFVVEKMKSTPLPVWIAYARTMMIVNDYQYSSSLLYGGDSLVQPHFVGYAPKKLQQTTTGVFKRHRETGSVHLGIFGLGHNPSKNGFSGAPMTPRAAEGEAEGLLRDEWMDESQLVNSEMYQRCTYIAAMHLPELTDNMFARMAVPEPRRERAEQVTRAMIDAVAEDIEASTVLSSDSKRVLTESVRLIQPRVSTPWHGEPPASLPYDVDAQAGMLRNAKSVRRRNIAQNTFEALLFNGKPATQRRSMAHHFDMGTNIVNAYFDPPRPSISILSGIITAPFFSEHYSNVSVAARFGALVGHELTHRTDANSKAFDSFGNLGKDWMPEEMSERYTEVEQCFVDRYEDYHTPLGNQVDGRQTLGENMADTMGLRAALRALTKMLDREPTAPELREFLLSYAQMWCAAPTAEEEQWQIQEDVHAPAAARIDNTLGNLETPGGKHAMQTAFGCPVGSPMHPVHLCKVW